MPPRGTNSPTWCASFAASAGGSRCAPSWSSASTTARVPWVTRLDDGDLRAIAGPDMVILRTPVALHGDDCKTVGEFAVAAGETCRSSSPTARRTCCRPAPIDPDQRARRHRSVLAGVGRPLHLPRAVVRRGHALADHAEGADLSRRPAASSRRRPRRCPEQIGGARNWDYRYCWLRDATFTLLALMNAGYYDEARAWRDWLLRAVAGEPGQIQIMYGVGGRASADE